MKVRHVAEYHPFMQLTLKQDAGMFSVTRHTSLFHIKFSVNTQSDYDVTHNAATHANICLTVRGRRSGRHNNTTKMAALEMTPNKTSS